MARFHMPVNLDSSLSDLVGKKYRAPHKHLWGEVMYHNSVICSVPNQSRLQPELRVHIRFLNPTHTEMIPCPYFFDMIAGCVYGDECSYSHGELVPFSSLQRYIPPNFENLTKGSYVFAKRSDHLWHHGKVVHFISKGLCIVKFDTVNMYGECYDEIQVDLDNILPLDVPGSDIEEDREVYNRELEEMNSGQNQDNLNSILMTVPEPKVLGEWEKHTRGIGSRLLRKMGYNFRGGLGKRGSGSVEAVKVWVMPPGKSLDFCMALKEKIGPHSFSEEMTEKKKEAYKELCKSFNQQHKSPKKKISNKKQEKEALTLAKVDLFSIPKYLQWIQSNNTRDSVSPAELLLFKQKLSDMTKEALISLKGELAEKLAKLHKQIQDFQKNIRGGGTAPPSYVKRQSHKVRLKTNLFTIHKQLLEAVNYDFQKRNAK